MNFPEKRESVRPRGETEPQTLAIDCTTMAQVRDEIDRIDRQLVSLIGARQTYIEAAARIKTCADEVRLEWRIADVLSKVLREADAQGLSKRIAEPVWRELMDRCIEHEHEKWRAFHTRNDI